MKQDLPSWLDMSPWLRVCERADDAAVRGALSAAAPGVHEFAVLLSAAAAGSLETMARRALAITRRHFGRAISLYVPLYLSSYCSGGCVYCGFASDRQQTRHRLEKTDLLAEIDALKQKGFEDVLLLTGERSPEADFGFLLDCVSVASERFHRVTVESFAMTVEEYRMLAEAGCTGITLYQETYDDDLYGKLHRWGPKRDFISRLEAPARALEGGLRTVGMGALLGLSDPVGEVLALFQHMGQLRKRFWEAGVSVSFPRIRPQDGGFVAPWPVGERLLAQIVFAFRICLPDTPLVLSTRERASFRDGIAGIGICKMSVSSRTTVGGYREQEGGGGEEQFRVDDSRDVDTFCRMLRSRELEPVFKNWDAVYRQT